jgi:hypothetical protein
MLYVLFDISCFFTKVELELFLGVISPNYDNVGGALLQMVHVQMIIMTANRNGTEQYYLLGHIGTEALRRSTLPDINNRPNKYLQSIELRRGNGNKMISNRRKKAKAQATKKCDSPPKNSAKVILSC